MKPVPKKESPSGRCARAPWLFVLLFAVAIAYMSVQGWQSGRSELGPWVTPPLPPQPVVPDYAKAADSSSRSFLDTGQVAIDFDAGAGSLLDARGRPVSWTLELISLSRKADAQAFEAQLQKGGYPAYMRQMKDGQGTAIYKVFAGQTLDRGKLKAMRQGIERKYSIVGIPVRFHP
ncbi:MAG: SPOR domain-containing protein [Kistimonas sp.]|nr:SPOR domain-containing protein [Kistimonas sp.]